ncbi:MAG: ribosome biogenesis GTPase Der [Thermoanaerobaculia bacterium]|nr:ribosome biogenesis GTPase Der [Thermoanaerobaculia bacterium]
MTIPGTPTVSIVGRPNVGKSTLFNRLVGRRKAIVHDTPGVTRDRVAGRIELGEGRTVELLDTGGLALAEDELGLNQQILLAVEESDLLLLVVDGKEGLTAADEEVCEILRKYDKPTILVVNKGDTKIAQRGFGEFYALGIDPLLLVSAEHGRGIPDLEEAIRTGLPDHAGTPEPEGAPVAIVGRPNVGKSSLLNRVVGSERVLVSPRPGTTRDPVDTLFRWEDRSFLLVDTAGIRRRSKVADAPEGLAVMMARRQIERAEIVLLVVSAEDGITSGDLSIAGAAWEMGRAVVVAVNKWDLLDDDRRLELDRSWGRLATLLSHPPRVNVSTLTGRGVEKVLPALRHQVDAFHTRLGTGAVNRLLESAVEAHPPPAEKGTSWKLYYATQVGEAPPTFMLFANRTLRRSDPYRRYLENRIREELGLPGVPVRLVIRRRT